MIRQVTESAVADARKTVSLTAKKLDDGSPNPNYEEAVAELAELERDYARKMAFVARAAQQGFRRNSYAGSCVVTGAEVKAGAGFVRKNEVGKWQTYSFAAVVEIVGQ